LSSAPENENERGENWLQSPFSQPSASMEDSPKRRFSLLFQGGNAFERGEDFHFLDGKRKEKGLFQEGLCQKSGGEGKEGREWEQSKDDSLSVPHEGARKKGESSRILLFTLSKRGKGGKSDFIAWPMDKKKSGRPHRAKKKGNASDLFLRYKKGESKTEGKKKGAVTSRI